MISVVAASSRLTCSQACQSFPLIYILQRLFDRSRILKYPGPVSFDNIMNHNQPTGGHTRQHHSQPESNRRCPIFS